ncbi:MAG: hypothetical protein K2O78_00155 [Muribaculaceae bacterium]|nr:hypothetical protein [Muribaculaceae bacterium]
MKRGADISAFLQPLAEVPTQAFLSNVVQTADILEWILEQTGPAEVWQTSFSISEEFLRRLHFIQQRNPGTEVHLVLDFKATQKTLRLWVFLSRVMKSVHLAENHSKVIVIRPRSAPPVAVVTSQNLTRGNRYEAHTVTSDPPLCAALFDGVRDIIDNHSVPLDELLGSGPGGG